MPVPKIRDQQGRVVRLCWPAHITIAINAQFCRFERVGETSEYRYTGEVHPDTRTDEERRWAGQQPYEAHSHPTEEP